MASFMTDRVTVFTDNRSSWVIYPRWNRLLLAIVGLSAFGGLIGLAKVFTFAPLVTLSAVVGIILFVISFLKPVLGLLLWAGLLGFQVETYSTLGVNIAPADLILIALLLNIILRILLKKITIPKTRTAKWLLGLIIIFTIGLLKTLKTFGYLPRYAIFNKYLGFCLLIASYYMIVTIVNNRQILASILQALFITGVIVNYIVLCPYLLYVTKIGSGLLLKSIIPIVIEGGRLRGFLLDPNAYGGFVALLLIYALSGKTQGLAPRALEGLNIFSLTAGLFFTFSRSAWLGFIIGFLVILYSTGIGRFRIQFKVLPSAFRILVMLGLGIAIVGFLAILLRILNLDSRFLVFRDFTLTQRLALIDNGWRLFTQSPIFGIGLGAFHELAPTIIHNSYIWVLVEMGPFALILLLALFVQAVSNCLAVSDESTLCPQRGACVHPPKVDWTNRAWEDGHRNFVFCCAGLFALYGIGLGIEVLYQRHLWLLFGLADCLRRDSHPL
uniref:O-antigen ligase domain-containing protein n=1 Tax=candidate division WOR-3 bacterium TaxID=2052148 RepID=A0A7C6A9S1_UNCW3